uniref:Uncharacterized protein n=1 Tax=Cacopsylla melanoneura TaxID=428564 RepID=A0A8D8TGZ6_9HEMI
MAFNAKNKVTSLECKTGKGVSNFQWPMRCLIVGSSGSGKTTLVWNIISKNWIPYKQLYIHAPSLDQDIYQNIIELFDTPELADELHLSSTYDDLPSVDECESGSLIIFDDCMLDKDLQNKIEEYWSRSRPKNISCVYLVQSLTKIDPRVIRESSNFLILFRQKREHIIKLIWKDFAQDFTYTEFQEICRECWRDKHGFLSIDVDNGKYYNKFIEIERKT